MKPAFDFNCHVLVTGGSSGIGAAIAHAFFHAGARVTICGRSRKRLAEASLKGSLQAIPMDVTCEESVQEATSLAVAGNGDIHVHVANAGIAMGCPFDQMELELWRRILAVNLDGAYLSIRASLPSMRKAGRGRIIAVSSVAGLKGLKSASAYTVSKHGLIGLVRALSEELMHTGITANALCPGYVDTPLLERNVDDFARVRDITRDEALAKFLRLNRHHRIVRPDEVASAALWLCGPGSGSINGQVIPIAGGQV